MKHTIISLTLILLLLVFSIFSAFYVTNTVEESIRLLELAQQMETVGNNHGAVQAIQAAKTRWQSHQVYYGTVLRHDEVDDVLRDFSSLSAYAQDQERAEFRSGCASLLTQLRHIQQMEWPYFHNVM